ncbi:putative toxin-antitoxin system toxin component, PIN family [Methylotuvimicrobium sp. KM1]
MRVIIDTNLWISFLIGKSLAGLTDALISNRITIAENLGNGALAK